MKRSRLSDIMFSTLGHLLRRSILLALKDSSLPFSELMRICGLNPDHDSGLFVYHLSQLTTLKLIERTGEEYRLSSFGERTADFVSAMERESAFLTENTFEEMEVKEMSDSIKTEWLNEADMHQKGVIISTEKDFVPKMTEEEMKDYKNVKEWSKINQYLLVSKAEKPIAHLEVDVRYIISAERENETQPIDRIISIKPYFLIKQIFFVLWATNPAEREKAVTALLAEVEEEGRKLGIRKITLYQVNADDKTVISALKQLGYQRFATRYMMTKEL